MSKTSSDSNNIENKTKRKRHKRTSSKQNDKQVNNDVLRANRDFVHFLDLNTLSSVKRPKHNSLIWKKKGSSNTSSVDLSSVSNSKLNKDVKRYSHKDLLSCNNSHHGDTRSAYACNDAMNVSCNSRLYASYDVNDLFVFDDVIIINSRVSKMPFRKKPRDSLNVRSKSNSNNSLPRTLFRWLPKMQPLAEPVAKWIPKVKYLLTGDRSSNLYTIALNEIASNSSACLLAKASFSQSWSWHQRRSHLNFATINNLVKNNLVRGLPKMKFEKDHLCSAYEQGKIHRKHHKSKTAFASNKPLYLLHMDLCGPMHVESINGKRYVLVVVDDYSRYTWVFFLHSKDEASTVIISFIKQTQVNLQLQVQRVGNDNGTEFKNKTLAKFFDVVGISQQFSAARTPQQNGVEERINRTLVEATRTMLTFANLPLFLWLKPSQHRALHKIVRLLKTVSIKLLMSSLTRENQTSNSFMCLVADVIYSMIMMMLESLRQKGILECLLDIQNNLHPSEFTIKSSKKDLEELFHDFYDEYFDASKISKSPATNVETSTEEISPSEEVFHESSKSFQEESSSSSLNANVQQSLEEVTLVTTGRVVVPTGRYVVPAGKVIIIVSPGRLSLVPTGRVLSPGRVK
ncbi:retrovirus-related pol polyprotein from transposon TNT 1-94 [Tanacetum coccineum]